mmetsp:Transcript_39001/g.90310  ORF Transcript_39001/g.90310 Transcript_39001/m.90310 type:complete len:204 (-) Transcript_39001:77-688(-)
MHRADGRHRLLVNVSGFLELAQPDEVVAEGNPQAPDLIRELPDATPNDGLDVQRLDVGRMLGDQVAKVHPQLMPRLSLHRAEILVVHHTSELLRCFIVLPDGAQVGDVDLDVVRLEHEVSSKRTQGRLLWNFSILDELHVQLPDAGMLRDGQRPKSAIERPSGTSDLLLLHQKLDVVKPDTRHLVQKHKGTLKGVVGGLILRI